MTDLPVWPGRFDLESQAWEEVQATPPTWAVETPPVNPDKFCAHCGQICGTSESGLGSYNGEVLCHPESDSRPDCYNLVVAGHPMPCLKCFVAQVTNEDLLEVEGE